MADRRDKFHGFTLIELLVVIAIVALLMSILMPALQRARKQARTALCQSRLHQWGLILSMYTGQNDGFFISGLLNDSATDAGSGRWWMKSLEPFYDEPKLRLCPEATRHDGPASAPIGRDSFDAWVVPLWPDEIHFDEDDADVILDDFPCLLGSYGPNGWICNPPATTSGGQKVNNLWGRTPINWHWRNAYVKRTNEIPVFLDCMWVDAWPKETDEPAVIEEWRFDMVGEHEMRRFCVNRHQRFVNVLFMDWSVRKVGLKELWTLRWHKEYDTCAPATLCGFGGDVGAYSAWWNEKAPWMKNMSIH